MGRSGWFGDRFRTVFGSFSDNFRIVFGSFSDRFRIVVGSFSDSFSDRFRIILGHVWDGPGIIFGTFSELLLGPFCEFFVFWEGGGRSSKISDTPHPPDLTQVKSPN